MDYCSGDVNVRMRFEAVSWKKDRMRGKEMAKR